MRGKDDEREYTGITGTLGPIVWPVGASNGHHRGLTGALNGPQMGLK